MNISQPGRVRGRRLAAAVLAGLLSMPATAAPPAPPAPAAAPDHAAAAPGSPEEIARARAELQRARAEMARAAADFARLARAAAPKSPRAQAWAFAADPDRAMLGVTIADGPQSEGRSTGVLVTGVTPGGGAEKAGLRSGDLLLSANGQSLAGPAPAGGPERLREIMSALKPGDQVAVEYRRDGKTARATVTATRPEPPMVFGWQEDEDFDVLVPPQAPLPPALRLTRRFAGASGGLELARLDEDLAGYFKTRDGVLVVQAPQGGTLALKSGDVIRRINDRPVASPVAAWEEIAQAGERGLVLEVVRHGKTLSVEGTLAPEPRRIERRVRVEK